MLKLTYLLQIAVTSSIFIGCLSPNFAQGATLFQVVIENGIPIVGNLDANGNGVINFSRTVSNRTYNGKVIAENGLFALSSGGSVQGTLLTLTQTTFTYTGTASIPSLPNAIVFSYQHPNLSFPIGTELFAHQLFEGGLTLLTTQPQFSVSAEINPTFTPTLTISPSVLLDPSKAPYVNQFSDFKLGSSVLSTEANTPLITGSVGLTNVVSNQQLNLPNSACVFITKDDVPSSETQFICDQAVNVPEPTSTLGLLLFAVVGATGELIYIRHKKVL